MHARQTLLLSRTDISDLVSFSDVVGLVEGAFRAHASQETLHSERMHVDCSTGSFHLKAGGIRFNHPYFTVKVNAIFPDNPKILRIPKTHGLIILCDGEDGYPLAVLDSRQITIWRTGAAVAVGAKYLARTDSTVATVVGCGIQGRIQLRALKEALPIRKAFAISRTLESATQFATEMSEQLGIEIEAIQDIPYALSQSDVCVTCTRSKTPILHRDWIRSGLFIAAVGADSPEKQELDPTILTSSKVIVDIIEQCVTAGELHHAITHGMKVDSVWATLGEVLVGSKQGRESRDEVIVLDLTGTAFQDTVAAVAVYEIAMARGLGSPTSFFEDPTLGISKPKESKVGL